MIHANSDAFISSDCPHIPLSSVKITKKLQIACIGAGYVGGPTSAVFAWQCPHVDVQLVDISKERIDLWNSDTLPIFEPKLNQIMKSCRNKNLFLSTNVDKAIEMADIIFISVNTPTKMHGLGAGKAADLMFIESAARKIAQVATSSKIVVERSTVPCRTAELIRSILDANARPSLHFDILSNPEFLSEGSAVQDLLHPDRVLIGSLDTPRGLAARTVLVNLYATWVPRDRILTTNLWSSELAKLAANAFLAQRISSINSLSALCESVGADIEEVGLAIGMDSRIGSKYLNASIGFGGSCFKKDILNLVYMAEQLHLSEVATYWNQVLIMNEHQTSRFTTRIFHRLNQTLRGKHIAVLGFAFKKNTGDTRDSAAIPLCKFFYEEGAVVHIYDPKVSLHQLRLDFDERILTPQGPSFESICLFSNLDVYAMVNGVEALVICTEWDEFKFLDYEKIYDMMKKPSYLFDGRLLLDHKVLRQIGFHVECIGKPQFL